MGNKAIHCHDAPKHAGKIMKYCKGVASKTIDELKARKPYLGMEQEILDILEMLDILGILEIL